MKNCNSASDSIAKISSLLVSVNESYAVVLEGPEEGETGHTMTGVYERVENKEVDGNGVWQVVGGMGLFLYYDSSKKAWLVSDQEGMDGGRRWALRHVRPKHRHHSRSDH
jgi:hypothetical protein